MWVPGEQRYGIPANRAVAYLSLMICMAEEENVWL